MKKKISILGMPMNGGQPKKGTHFGPEALRNAGINKRLMELNYSVTDLGDLDLGETVICQKNKSLKNLDHVISTCTELAENIEQMDTNEVFPLILGGDHSMTIGTLAGLGKKYDNLGVIWVDAHGDLNTNETSPSGNIHGMSLSASLGIGADSLTNVRNYSPKVQARNVVQIGARDLDEGEKELIKEMGLKVYTTEDVKRLGMDQVISETIEYLSHCDGVHLSLDIDAFCPTLAPGTGTVVEDGISKTEGSTFLNALNKSNLITSMEIAEVNPLLEGDGNQTALFAVDMVSNLFA